MERHTVEIEDAEQDRRIFVRVNRREVDIYIDEDGILITLSRDGEVLGELSDDF